MFQSLKEGMVRNAYRSACHSYGARCAQAPTVTVLCCVGRDPASHRTPRGLPLRLWAGRKAASSGACDSGEERVSGNKHTLTGITSRSRKAAVSQSSNKEARASPGGVSEALRCCGPAPGAASGAPAAAAAPAPAPRLHHGHLREQSCGTRDIWSELTE